MRTLILLLSTLLIASTAFANSVIVKGNVTLETFTTINTSNLRIEGPAAKALYKNLNVAVQDLGGTPKATGKIGKSISCFKDFQVKGYSCSMNMMDDGLLLSDRIVLPLPSVGGSNPN